MDERLTRRNPDGTANFAFSDFDAVCHGLLVGERATIRIVLEKLAEYEDGVEQICERLQKELENKQYASNDAAKAEYAGIVYGLRNALLMLGEGKRLNAESG